MARRLRTERGKRKGNILDAHNTQVAELRERGIPAITLDYGSQNVPTTALWVAIYMQAVKDAGLNVARARRTDLQMAEDLQSALEHIEGVSNALGRPLLCTMHNLALAVVGMYD